MNFRVEVSNNLVKIWVFENTDHLSICVASGSGIPVTPVCHVCCVTLSHQMLKIASLPVF